MSKSISIFDTTLRDGTQGEGISLSADDKLKIAKKLDDLGVHYIEGGIPGSNNKDIEFFKRVKELHLNAKITAFGSTRRKNSLAENDDNLKRMIDAGVPAATLVGKSWDFHVHTALQTTLEENLAMIGDSISYLKRQGLEVIFDAEHFFDGYKNNPEYAAAVLSKAREAGADWLVMCDTNGGTLPYEIHEIVTALNQQLPGANLGIHTHNDCELAVANALSAIGAGARQVQGTINGYGERCGNANLCSIIPTLQIKMGYHCIPGDSLSQLTNTARYISEVANVNLPVNQPYVGNAAFAHKGGIHVSAIMRDSRTYEHIAPELVGNKQRVLVSELAGQSNVLSKAQDMGLNLDPSSEQARRVIEKIKTMEHQGYQFEGADASLELLLREATGEMNETFTFESFKMLVEKTAEHPVVSEAFVKLKVGSENLYTAAEGNGPVNALDNALRKALQTYFPQLKEMHLSDYKVRVIDEQDQTAAKVRVLIESKNFTDTWSTVGVSSNVIEASWEALVDSMRYALLNELSLENEKTTSNEPRGLVNH
ncbi:MULTISPECIES: citramalate synthase [Paenibacillus]|uniref:Citramalate synthase n=2 Tax=Paenibacillus odorifer TaxID=189426 RepID=A0A1R0XE16_9BACL|nr:MULTISPECIES: citramalate synthase [Paenibacillus]AIQ73622.1 transferase [Paenibacillus odorifer]AWV32967.1 citramalate synthase [Paenibacillus odorifer]ETT45322.1 alpha-isopropylmalate/homocitrate synthase family transferase [Paenibacillus sp. FSL H8-237]OMD00235.1 citramalate synthase [Paenibacillus odorifer]OMD04456.1 citramalate synthase [Paenibacillus odorifer]